MVLSIPRVRTQSMSGIDFHQVLTPWRAPHLARRAPILGHMTPRAARTAVPSPQDLLRKATRRQSFSATTRKSLLTVAAELFTSQGYAGTSLDEIVAGAKVTKGALYHHFKGKTDLFEEVFVAVEDAAAAQIAAAIRPVPDPWEKAVAGLREFLSITRTDAYRRVVIQEGPVVLGYERYREHEERSTYGLVLEIVSGILSPYELPDATVHAFARIFFGAMSATGSAVSTAQDADRASADAEGAIVLILAGLRSLVESGGPLPTAEELATSPWTRG